jgi:hypothetical protein
MVDTATVPAETKVAEKPALDVFSGPSIMLANRSQKWERIGSIPPGMPADKLGKPCHYVWFEGAAIPGVWRNEARGFTLTATPKRIEHWNASISEMLAAEIRLPIGSDHIPGALRNEGFIVGSRVRNGELDLLCQLIGDDALDLAAKNYGSAEFFASITEPATGKKLVDVIGRLSITPEPLFSGQNGFVEAASIAGDESAIVLYASKEIPVKTMCMSDEQWDAMHSAVPGMGECSMEEKPAMLLKHLGKTPAAVVQKASLDAGQAKQLRKAVDTRIKSLQEARHLSQKCAEDLLPALCGTPEKPLLASLESEGDADPLAFRLLDALESNIITASERTGIQVASRVVPDDKPKTEEKEPAYKGMLKSAAPQFATV